MTQTSPTKPFAFNQLFRDFREKFRQKVLKRYELPWMKSKELDIIIEVLSRQKPKVCFEWGSGFSTLYFPKIFSFIEKWYSIEHNEDWYKTISQKINDPRVTLTYVQRNHTGSSANPENHNDGSYEDFKNYVEFPASLAMKFDFMFIDGRARKDCLKKAFDLVADEGVVIVHDANRDYYVSDMPPFANVLRLTDYRKKRGGILLASKSKPITSILDVEAHKAAWKNHDRIAKALFMR
jgi:predicted O-methyltransferase YrrM